MTVTSTKGFARIWQKWCPKFWEWNVIFGKLIKFILMNELEFESYYYVSDDIHVVKDGRYGSQNASVPGRWTGIIGELINNVIRSNRLGHQLLN